MRMRLLPAPDVRQISEGQANGKELSRLMAAALVNRAFCSTLLANPAMALATGYQGEAFNLAREEQELILSIQATSLADFAKQVIKNRNGHSHNHNGNGHNSHRD